MSRLLLAASALAALTTAVGCGGSKSGTLKDISVTPANSTIGLNQMAQFLATLNYDKGKGPSTKPAIVWSSSDTAVATIDATGRATGKAVGMTNIIARAGGKMGMAVLRVSAEKVLTAIQITPAAPRVPIRRAVALTATGIYSDGTNANLTAMVDWASSVPANATVTNTGAKGVVIGVKAGTSRISAKMGTVMGETEVTVTEPKLTAITVDPPTATIARMTTRQFTATATYDDATTLNVTNAVVWTSSMMGIATVSNTDGSRGVATGIAAGTTTITATLEDKAGTAALTVSGMVATGLVVTPANPALGLGASQQFTATATFPDMSTQDVTADATWTSSMTGIATVDADGRATALAMGTTTITATFGTVTGSTVLTVTNATVMTITVTPAGVTLARGTTQQYMASARYTDNTMRDVTTEVTWGSLLETVATVSNADGSKGLATAVNAGETKITASLGGQLGDAVLTVTAATLRSIAISPLNATIANTTSIGFEARGLFSDGTNQDLTTEVAWQSSNAAVATISNADGTEGVATGVAPGFVDITASLGTISASTKLTITTATLASISVTPPLPRLAQGTSQQLKATGTFSDGTVQDVTSIASWTSTLTAVATVSATGRTTAVAPGTATIRATIGTVQGSATVTVTNATLTSITLSPANPLIAKDTTVDLTASGLFNDGTNQDLTDQVTWESAAAAVATVASGGATPGRVRGNSAGMAMITARFGTTAGSTTVTVTNATLTAIAVAPAAVTIAKTTMTALTATGTFSDMTTQNVTPNVFWATSNAAIATVSNGTGTEGQVTGLTAGMANITATLLGVTGMSVVTVTNAVITSLAVTPATATVVRGTTQQYTATGTFTEGATVTTQNLNLQAVWTSSAPAVASISNAAGSRGLATGLTPGMTTITGTFNLISGTAALTVSNALVSVSISPGAPTVVAGGTVQLTATGVFEDNSTSDLTEDATWMSSNAIAGVSTAMGSRGLVTAGAMAGTSVITATVSGKMATVTVTVTASPLVSITLSPLGSTTPLGTSPQFTATANYMNGSTGDITADVTWASSNTAVATISNAMATAGKVTTLTTGTTMISATLGLITASTGLTVSAATLATITITPANIKIAKTTKLQLQAIGTFTDMTTVDLTTTASWGVGAMGGAIASVSNASGEQGQVLGLAAGTTTVTATSGTIVGSTPIEVTNAVIIAMAVTPAGAMIPAGFGAFFTATGTFFDAMTMETTTQNLNLQATWGSSNGAVASISNGTTDKGRAAALTAGMTTISAVFNGVSGSTVMTVTAATLITIAVNPNPRTIAKGTTQQFTATGIYSDNTTQDLTAMASWVTTNAPVATVDPTGLATGLTPGQAGIKAGLMGIEGIGVLNVTNATIQSMVVRGTPPAAMMDPAVSIAAGTTHQFYAVGTFSDTSTQDLTSQVTWASSNLGLATIDATGLATGVAAGAPSITAIFRDATTNGTLAASRPMTVTTATLVSIAVTPAASSVAIGLSVNLTATGTFSDGTTQNITASVTWMSTAEASVGTIAPNIGKVTGVSAGTATVTASDGAVMGSATVTVTAAVLQSIAVTPAAQTIANGATLQFTATGTMSDGSMPDSTSQVTWASSNSAAAGISNDAMGMTQGLATATPAGAMRTTTISAFLAGKTGSTTLTVQ